MIIARNLTINNRLWFFKMRIFLIFTRFITIGKENNNKNIILHELFQETDVDLWLVSLRHLNLSLRANYGADS